MIGPLAAVLRSQAFRNLHRHRNYRLYVGGQMVSLAGTWMQHVALTWLVLELSRSPIAVGALAFCRFLPFTLFGLVAGVLVDRFDSRRLLAFSQAAAMATSVALAVVVLTGAASLPLVYALAAIGGALLVVEAPSRHTLTFEMVGPRELPNAVALNAGLLNAARVVGPAIAGVLIGVVGVGACFLVNAASFFGVLAALVLMRPADFHPAAKDTTVSIVRGTREGLRHAMRTPDLRRVLGVIAVVGIFGLNFNTLVPLLASDTLRVDSETFGILSASFGLGALAGALLAAAGREARWVHFAAATAVFSVLMLGLAATRDAWLAGLLLACVGAAFSVFTTNAGALLQLGAPERLRGRIVSLYLYAFIGLSPIGALLSGWLTDRGGTSLAFGCAGAAGLAAVAAASIGHARAGRAATRSHSFEGSPPDPVPSIASESA